MELTINQAAKLKGVSRQAIHAAIKRGDLVAVEYKTTRKFITERALANFQPDLKRQASGQKGGSSKSKKHRKSISNGSAK